MSKHSLLLFQRFTALLTALQDTRPCRCQSTVQREAGAIALFSVPWLDLTQYFTGMQDTFPRSSCTERALKI